MSDAVEEIATSEPMPPSVADPQEPGSLDPIVDSSQASEPSPEPEAQSHDEDARSEAPIHHAWCMTPECGAKVTYRPTSSGTGFMVLERSAVAVDATFGIGPHGRPTCPRGHGEMTMADEQLPVEEAFTQAAEQVNREATQMRLPGTTPPFNDTNALEHIIQKRHEYKALHTKYEELVERAKKLKKAVDECGAQVGILIDNYEERRAERELEIKREQERAEAKALPTLIRCAWERMHPGDVCPVCTVEALKAEARFGTPDSEQHAVEVRNHLEELKLQQLDMALQRAGVFVPRRVLSLCSTEEYAAVEAWAIDPLHAENRALWVANIPAALGRPHVIKLQQSDEGGSEVCEICGAFLLAEVMHESGALVGEECSGPQAEPARQIPSRKKSKKKARR